MSYSNVEQKVKTTLRVARTNKLIEAACLIALGLVLFIWSGTALNVICQAIAGIITVLGIVIVAVFLMGRSRMYGSAVALFGGVVAIVMGMYLFFNPQILIALVPTIIGLIVVVTGLVDLSESMRIVRQRSGGVTVALIITVAEIILGVVFIIHPVFIEKILMKFMALTLIADGIADIWIMFQIGKAEKPLEAMAAVAAGNVVDGEVTPLMTQDSPAAAEAPRTEAPRERPARRGFPHPFGAKEEPAAPAAPKFDESVPSKAPEAANMNGYTTIQIHKEPAAQSPSDAGAPIEAQTPAPVEAPAPAAASEHAEEPRNDLNGIAKDAADAGVTAH